MSPTIMLSEREWVALNVIAINDDTSVDDIIEEAIEAYVTRMCMNGSSIGERASEALAGNYTRNDYEDEFGKLGWYRWPSRRPNIFARNVRADPVRS